MVTITVITICYNEEKNIARTIESVASQTSLEYEYIVCDGLSKDRTVGIAESYKQIFAQKGVSYQIYSEKDCGIYDAMNKGIDKANGKYICFLNAGDWFVDDKVLTKFLERIKEDATPAVIYGNFYYVERHRATLSICDDSKLEHHMSIGHPSMIARTDLMKAEKFNTEYKIAADYNFVLGLKMKQYQFKHIDVPVAYFMVGGVSSLEIDKVNEELEKIHTSYGLPFTKRVVTPLTWKQKLISWAPDWLLKFWVVKMKHKKWFEY